MTVAEALIAQLPAAYQVAKNLKEKWGVKIYRLFCLIFKILYSFLQMSAAASDRERLGQWSVKDFTDASISTAKLIENFSFTDANSLALDQICKQLGYLTNKQRQTLPCRQAHLYPKFQ